MINDENKITVIRENQTAIELKTIIFLKLLLSD
jgi:hypothetical protein